MVTNKLLVSQLFQGKETITFKDIVDLQDQFKEDLWHYDFYKMEPNDEGKISIKNFLMTNMHCLAGHNIDRFIKQIEKISDAYDDEKVGVTLAEYVAC